MKQISECVGKLNVADANVNQHLLLGKLLIRLSTTLL
jgi:hypothetical protein